MIDTNALRSRIAEKGFSQARVAESMGITPKTFYEKIGPGVFGKEKAR